MLTNEEVFNTAVWNRVKQFVNKEICGIQKRLAKAATWEEVLRLQGQIKGLESFLSLELDKENIDG